jgi:hypothetical protein
MVSVVMLIVIILSLVMLNVFILSVVGQYTYVAFTRHLVELEQGEDCLKNVNYIITRRVVTTESGF